MMQYDFLIAGVRLRLYSEEALVCNWQTELFFDAPAKPELTVHLHLVGKLPQPSGKKVETGWETRLYIEPDSLWQETYHRRDGSAIIRSCFMPDKAQVELWARRDYMPYPVRSWVLWSAMDLPRLLLDRGVVTLHSASILHKGKVILFTAPAQTGKSTQARLWHSHRGAQQLNGDKNCIAIRKGIPTALGTPLSGTSDICTPYEAPLGAIVLVRQAPYNRVTRLRGAGALLAVMENCFAHREEPGSTARLAGILGEVLSTVPVFELACTPDENAVCALEKEV